MARSSDGAVFVVVLNGYRVNLTNTLGLKSHKKEHDEKVNNRSSKVLLYYEVERVFLFLQDTQFPVL